MALGCNVAMSEIWQGIALGSVHWRDGRRFFRWHGDELAFYARAQDAQHPELGALDCYG